jgi:tripartite-type tricarboxylate transporter receptor subunit TctC
MNAPPAYPDRAVRYVVPFGEGITAAQARWLAQQLGERWAQTVEVECRPGASGRTGTAMVAHSAPDGYTLLAANPGPLTVGPALRKDIPYDPIADFAPVILMATVTSVICVHPQVPAANIAGLISLARKGELRYGSPGVGTVGHLAMELFQHLAGVRLAHLPREGLPEAIPELASGLFDVLVIPLPDARPLALAGAIRALALTKSARSELWPELPTVAEAGVHGFESFNWNGVAAPAGTPRAIVERVNAGVNEVLQSEEGRAYFTGRGYDIAGGTPEAFAAFIASETRKWAGVARLAGIAAD